MKLNSILAVAVLVLSLNGAQASDEWRAGGSLSNFTYNTATNGGWGLSINADWGHALSTNLQLIGLLGLGYNSSTVAGVTGTNIPYSIMAGLRYNFGDKIQESMFLQAAVGIGGSSTSAAGSTTSTSGMGWDVGIGNRYKIADAVSYVPQVGVNSVGATGTTVTNIYAKLVNFAIWF